MNFVKKYELETFTGNSLFDNDNKKEIMVTSQGNHGVVGNDTIKQFDLNDDHLWRFSGDNIFDKDSWENVKSEK